MTKDELKCGGFEGNAVAITHLLASPGLFQDFPLGGTVIERGRFA
jgi:hypothetical protein